MKTRSIRMKRAIAVCLAAGIIAGQAGCGGDGSSEGGEAPAGDASGTKVEGTDGTVADGGAEADGNGAAGGEVDYDAVLTMALTSGWTDLIPYNNASGGMYSMLVLGQLYDPLVYVSGDGTISPRGAKSWEMSEDHRTATFHLDERAVWHDGEPVTAEDYVFTAEMITDPACAASYKTEFDVLTGVDGNGVRDTSEELGMVAVDEYTIQLVFDNPVDLDTMLYNDCNYYPIPKHLLEDVAPEDYLTAEIWSAPVGSGPVKFESTVAGTELVTAANEEYHLGRPGFGKLIITYMSATNIASSLISGDIDLAFPALPSDDVELCSGYDNLNIYTSPLPSEPWMFVMANNYYTDKRVRQAFNYALDRELLCATLGDNFAPISTPVYPESKYYKEEYAWTYDPEKAVSILKECEADGTFSFSDPVEIFTPAGDREKAATVIQQNLKELGLEVTVTTTEAGAMFGGMVAGDIGIGLANFSINANPMYFSVMTSNVSPSYVMCTTDMWDKYRDQFAGSFTDEEKAAVMDSYQKDWLEEQPSIFYAESFSRTAYNVRLGDEIYFSDLNSNAYNWATWKLQATK